eukprot:TRINITY_DN18487_c0_g1_i1.p1 TRINITY_DN18487_c0_g1~~TRINITY_DN18487_c0_g1_i1.p1  ORF type:complete len:563 (+),score=92.87 TRINITY_DN18487_c0_g1_i1:122-1810(+)
MVLLTVGQSVQIGGLEAYERGDTLNGATGILVCRDSETQRWRIRLEEPPYNTVRLFSWAFTPVGPAQQNGEAASREKLRGPLLPRSRASILSMGNQAVDADSHAPSRSGSSASSASTSKRKDKEFNIWSAGGYMSSANYQPVSALPRDMRIRPRGELYRDIAREAPPLNGITGREVARLRNAGLTLFKDEEALKPGLPWQLRGLGKDNSKQHHLAYSMDFNLPAKPQVARWSNKPWSARHRTLQPLSSEALSRAIEAAEEGRKAEALGKPPEDMKNKAFPETPKMLAGGRLDAAANSRQTGGPRLISQELSTTWCPSPGQLHDADEECHACKGRAASEPCGMAMTVDLRFSPDVTGEWDDILRDLDKVGEEQVTLQTRNDEVRRARQVQHYATILEDEPCLEPDDLAETWVSAALLDRPSTSANGGGRRLDTSGDESSEGSEALLGPSMDAEFASLFATGSTEISMSGLAHGPHSDEEDNTMEQELDPEEYEQARIEREFEEYEHESRPPTGASGTRSSVTAGTQPAVEEDLGNTLQVEVGSTLDLGEATLDPESGWVFEED